MAIELNKNFKNISIRKSDHDMARLLADKMNIPIARLISELVRELTELTFAYDTVNLSYSNIHGRLTIKVSGKRAYDVQYTSEKELEKELEAHGLKTEKVSGKLCEVHMKVKRE